MTETQWQFFTEFKNNFKEQCSQWNEKFAAQLEPLQKAAASMQELKVRKVLKT